MSEVKTKEPLIRIIKRDRSSFGYKVWVRAAAIILALVVDAIFIYSVTGLNPLSVYGVMLNGTFMTSIRFSWAMRDLVTLLCIGIALAPAFKMHFWNIGAEGQVLVGGSSRVWNTEKSEFDRCCQSSRGKGFRISSCTKCISGFTGISTGNDLWG